MSHERWRHRKLRNSIGAAVDFVPHVRLARVIRTLPRQTLHARNYAGTRSVDNGHDVCRGRSDHHRGGTSPSFAASPKRAPRASLSALRGVRECTTIMFLRPGARERERVALVAPLRRAMNATDIVSNALAWFRAHLVHSTAASRGSSVIGTFVPIQFFRSTHTRVIGRYPDLRR